MAGDQNNASPADVTALLELTTTSQALLDTYNRILTSPQPPPTPSKPSDPNPPHPLQLLRDASHLLKSHATKLSLLILNEPFTPSAATKVLREITGTCLPAIMASVELARAEIWGRLLRGEIVQRVRTMLREVGEFLGEVRRIAQGGGGGGAGGRRGEDKEVEEVGPGSGRGTLASTGVLWEACDQIIELETLDVGGVALRKAQEWQALVKDAIQELKEWGEREDEGEDEDDDGLAGDDADDVFGAESLPRDRPELRELLSGGLGKLRKVDILYTALIKRRIKTFTRQQARSKMHVTTMDRLMVNLKRLPDLADELASGFYDLDEDAVRQQTQAVVDGAMGTIHLVRVGWNGEEDEFTTWSAKWIELV